MIYLNFLIDYLLCNLCGICSYFIFLELDNKRLVDVIICGLVVSFIYGDILFLLVIVFIYYFFKLLNIKKRYIVLKNILIIIVYVFIVNVLHIFL